jgi:hypothetical protein
MGIRQPAILHYSTTPKAPLTASRTEVAEAVALPTRDRTYSHFPLTCEASLPTFYAFSGVETAGEQEAQESCFPVRALTGSKLAAQSNF